MQEDRLKRKALRFLTYQLTERLKECFLLLQRVQRVAPIVNE